MTNSDLFVIGRRCAGCGTDEGSFHKEGCDKIKGYEAPQEKVDSVEFLRKQAYYRPGQEGQEREWRKQINAAADEIEYLREQIRDLKREIFHE